MKNDIQFDMQAAIESLRAGKDLSGKDGILTPLIKQLTEAAMQLELEEHLASNQQPNRKNGSTPKTVKSATGKFELNTPRDRAGTFEPQLVKKHQTQLTDELECKVLALFALWATAIRISVAISLRSMTCRYPTAPSMPLPTN